MDNTDHIELPGIVIQAYENSCKGWRRVVDIYEKEIEFYRNDPRTDTKELSEARESLCNIYMCLASIQEELYDTLICAHGDKELQDEIIKLIDRLK